MRRISIGKWVFGGGGGAAVLKVNGFPRSERVFLDPRSIHTFLAPKPQDSNDKTAGNEPPKVSMLRGFVLARSLRGKPFTFDLRAARIRLRGPHLGLIEAIARVVWAILGLIEAIIRAVGRLWALLGCLPALSRRHRPRLGWLLELSRRFGCCGARLAWRRKTKQPRGEASGLRTFGGR